jgi:hypothetical protein
MSGYGERFSRRGRRRGNGTTVGMGCDGKGFEALHHHVQEAAGGTITERSALTARGSRRERPLLSRLYARDRDHRVVPRGARGSRHRGSRLGRTRGRERPLPE